MDKSESNDSACDKNGHLKIDLETSPKAKISGEYSFEEALELTEIGKYHYKIALVCGMCSFFIMTEISGVSVALPVLSCDMNASIAERGLLLSSAFIGIILGSHALGFAADIWGRIYTLRIAFAACGLFILLSAFSVNMTMLIVMRIAVGILLSSSFGCIFTIIGENMSYSRRSSYLALVSAFQPLSNVIVPLFCMFILPLPIKYNIYGIRFVSWRFFYILSFTMCILSTLGMFWIRETPKFLLYQAGPESALEILREAFVSNTGKSADEYPVKNIIIEDSSSEVKKVRNICDACSVIWSQTIRMFTEGRWLTTTMFCIFMFILNGVIQGLFLWLPTILDRLISSSEENVQICQTLSHMSLNITNVETSSHDNCSNAVDTKLYIMLMIVGTVFTLSFFIFAFLIDLIGRRRLLVIWMFAITSFVCIIHFITNKFWIMGLLTMIVNVGICSTLVGTMAVDFYPTNICAMACCTIQMISRIGAVIGSNVVGQLIFTNCDFILWVMFGILGSLFVLGTLLPSDKKINKSK